MCHIHTMDYYLVTKRKGVLTYQFFSTRPSLWSNFHIHTTIGKTIALAIEIFVGKVMSLLFFFYFFCCKKLYCFHLVQGLREGSRVLKSCLVAGERGFRQP